MANYRSFSVEQNINADRALWVWLSDETRGKLQSKTCEARAFHAFTRLCSHIQTCYNICDVARSRPEQPFSSFQALTGGLSPDRRKRQTRKGKCKTPGPGIQVSDNCGIFVHGKQLCKRQLIGRYTAKAKLGKRCTC